MGQRRVRLSQTVVRAQAYQFWRGGKDGAEIAG
jgi:hypothetical protein